MPSPQEIVRLLGEAAAVTGPWAPLILFLATFVEHVVPPLPGDLVVVLGAWYGTHGELSWPLLLVFTTAGALAGAAVDHRIGVAVGRSLDRHAAHSRLLPPDRLARFEAAYRRWGGWLLVLNRFLPGVRAGFIVAAGASGIPLRRVLALCGLSALLWNAMLLALGALVARNLEELVALVERYMIASAMAFGAAVALWLAWLGWRRWRRGRA